MRLSNVSLAVMAAILATGCDDDSSSSTSTPAPATLNFSIKGVATDAPVANAVITATFGDQTATTTADQDGLYTLDFEYEEGSISDDDMVQISAKGEGDQSHVELISQLGSLGTLKEQAGDDGVLEQEESDRTAITQISTAMHYLAKQAGEVSSQEALEAAESLIDTEELLELSSIIKVLADNPEFTPEGEETIIDIFNGSEEGVFDSVETYFEEQGLLGEDGEFSAELEEAVSEAKQETIDDPSVTPDFVESDLTGSYLLHASTAKGWVPAFGDVINFADDNTATFGDLISYYIADDSEAEWNVTEDGHLVMAMEGPRNNRNILIDTISERFGTEVAELIPEELQGVFFTVYEYMSEVKLVKLTKGDDSKVVQTVTYTTVLDPEVAGNEWLTEAQTSEMEDTYTAVLTKADNAAEIWTEAPSGTWALPVVDQVKGYFDDEALDYIVHKEVMLKENMQVVDSEGNQIADWSFDSGVLTITANEDWTITYQPHSQVDGLITALVSLKIGDVEQSIIKWIAPFAQEASTLEQDFVQEMPTILGAWINAWRASSSDDELPAFDSVYGYTFTEDGQASWTSATWDNENNPYFLSDNMTFQEWASEEDYQYTIKGEQVDGSASKTRERQWTTIGTLVNGQHLVLESSIHTWEDTNWPDSNRTGQWVFPRINVLQPFDLSTYEEEYQRSLTNGGIVE